MTFADRELWLGALRLEMAQITTPEAQRLWPGPTPQDPPYFDYRLEHVCQVERYARLLHGEVGGDLDVVLAAVWIHDRFKPQFEGPWEHGALAGEWAEAHLASLGFPADRVEAVAFAVTHHAGFVPPRETVGEDRVEARILFDADKLDKYGVHAVTYWHMAWAAFPDKPLTMESSSKPERWLPRGGDLGERFFFALSARLAGESLARQEAYFASLKEELGLSGARGAGRGAREGTESP